MAELLIRCIIILLLTSRPPGIAKLITVDCSCVVMVIHGGAVKSCSLS